MNFKLTMPKFPGFTKILAGLLAVTMVLGSVNMTAFAAPLVERTDGKYQDGDLSGDASFTEEKVFITSEYHSFISVTPQFEIYRIEEGEESGYWEAYSPEYTYTWKKNGQVVENEDEDENDILADIEGEYSCTVSVDGKEWRTFNWTVVDTDKVEADRDAAKKEAETAKTAAETAKKDAEAAKKEVEAAKAEVAAAKKEAADAKAADTATKAKAEADLKAAQEKLAAAEAAQKKAEQKAASLEVPKKPSLKSVKAGKKKTLKVSWKKVAGVKGYEIQYATNKKFTKNVKTVKAKASKTSYTIKKLKAKKKYFVRIRGYKKVNGGTIYGKWSSVKNAKTKK